MIILKIVNTIKQALTYIVALKFEVAFLAIYGLNCEYG